MRAARGVGRGKDGVWNLGSGFGEDMRSASFLIIRQQGSWSRADESSLFALSARPFAKAFGLCEQLQRTTLSVMNNIAEGWGSLHIAGQRQACKIARRSVVKFVP